MHMRLRLRMHTHMHMRMQVVTLVRTAADAYLLRLAHQFGLGEDPSLSLPATVGYRRGVAARAWELGSPSAPPPSPPPPPVFPHLHLLHSHHLHPHHLHPHHLHPHHLHPHHLHFHRRLTLHQVDVATLFAAAALPAVASIEELSLTANQPKVSA